MLLDVLNRLAVDTGLNPVDQRNILINLLNHAAKEMYDKLESNKLLWEVTLSVPPNKIIALPSFIGELRGMLRSSTNLMLYPFQTIGAPRYVRNDWSFRYRNWRDLGENPVMQFPSVVGPLTISVGEVEDIPVTVYINGQTNNALRIEEKVVVSATSQTTTNLFGPQIYFIAGKQGQERTFDINITDANGQLLAVLYNMDNNTRYKMIDVSEFPWGSDTSDGNALVDVLYKVLLRRLTKDSDTFPAGPDYDTAWYWMSMHLYFKPMQKKPVDFENFYAYSIKAMQSIKGSEEDGLQKKISYGKNKFYDLTQGWYAEPYLPCNIIR